MTALETATESPERVSCVSVPVTHSKMVVAELMAGNPAIQYKRFSKALAVIPDSADVCAAAYGIVPDAYLIDEDAVTIYEVADTNPISRDKAARISNLYDELDDIGLDLRVIVLDYAGGMIADLPGWAYGPSLTQQYAPENCRDMTPAARAVTRNYAEGQSP